MIKGLFFKMNTENSSDRATLRFFDEQCEKEKCTKKELLNTMVIIYKSSMNGWNKQ